MANGDRQKNQPLAKTPRSQKEDVVITMSHVQPLNLILAQIPGYSTRFEISARSLCVLASLREIAFEVDRMGMRIWFGSIAQRCVGVTFLSPGPDDILVVRGSGGPRRTIKCAHRHDRTVRRASAEIRKENVTRSTSSAPGNAEHQLRESCDSQATQTVRERRNGHKEHKQHNRWSMLNDE